MGHRKPTLTTHFKDLPVFALWKRWGLQKFGETQLQNGLSRTFAWCRSDFILVM